MRPKLLLVIAFSAAALLPACTATAQDEASAKAFLSSTYRLYENGGNGPDLFGPHTSLYFHSSLVALIRADRKAVGQDIPACCDSDPVCGCQDWDGIWDLKIDIQMESPMRAEATVTFALTGPKNRTKDDLRKLKITLVPEHGEWRIYDVLDESGPDPPSDLREVIQKDIAYYAHHPSR